MKPQDWSDEPLGGQAVRREGTLTPKASLLSAGLLLGALVVVYWSTVVGLVNTWRTSDTYAHGALAIPIAGWLLWRQRARFLDVPLAPSRTGIVVLIGLSILWLAGDLSSIKSVREFAVVASVPLILVATLGSQFARRAVFPLFFCLFAWPFGEVFIPSMVNATADITVAALRVTGVPVYRDGTSFVIPSGNWSVVEECSGIRYLIVSVFAGTLFAYLTFRSAARRWAFVALSVVVPLFANWLRAYGIVLLGHLSGNRIATGVDHLVYGWLFFGIVMTILFYAGARWMAEPAVAGERDPVKEVDRPVAVGSVLNGLPWGFLVLGVVACSIGPAWSLVVTNREIVSLDQRSLALPDAIGEWKKDQKPIEAGAWAPRFENPYWQDHAEYVGPGGRLRLHVAVYERQREGSKLVSFQSGALADFGKSWRTLSSTTTNVQLDGDAHPLTVTERLAASMSRKVLSWDWSWIEGTEVSTLKEAKIQLLRQRLLLQQEAAVRVVIDTDDVAGIPQAAALLSSIAKETRALPAKLVSSARQGR